MQIQVIDMEQVKIFLQDVALNVSVQDRSSIANAENYDIPVPTEVAVGVTVAVHATSNTSDKFWIARIENIRSENPITYGLRYYAYNSQRKGWFLMRGKSAYGWVHHEGIITTNIEFNQNQSMKESSIRRINVRLDQS